MRVLLVGGGAREHALAWKMVRDDPAMELVAAPGNPGIATLGRCVAIPAADVEGLLALAHREGAALTVVGPEAPLERGIVDRFRAAGLAVFGPTAAAARLESSKSFAKEVMRGAGVPTARAERHTSASGAREAVRRFGAPVVIKACGLAAGKGVTVCATREEADAAVELLLVHHALGDAGAQVLVEEFMEGEELSLFALTDGHTALPLLPAQDHKRLLEGERGPNTGGMGAYAPVALGTPALVGEVMQRVVDPTLAALRARGTPFTGLLYVGLMLTRTGPRVVEFNCRFGDPETEALMPLLESSLLAPLAAIARGERLTGMAPLRWSARHAVTTVVAAADYPERGSTGAPIALPDDASDVVVFHAGTARGADGALVTAGGRVVAVTGLGATHEEAHAASARGAAAVHFAGRRYRRDIGWRERACRGAGPSAGAGAGVSAVAGTDAGPDADAGAGGIAPPRSESAGAARN